MMNLSCTPMTTSSVCGGRVSSGVGDSVGCRVAVAVLGVGGWVGVLVESPMTRNGIAVFVGVVTALGWGACAVIRALFSRNIPARNTATAARPRIAQRKAFRDDRVCLIVNSAGSLLLCSALYTRHCAYCVVRHRLDWWVRVGVARGVT